MQRTKPDARGFIQATLFANGSELGLAVMHVALEELQLAGGDVDTPFGELGITAMFYAGNSEEVHWLVNRGADVNFVAANGCTPLAFRIAFQQTDVALALLDVPGIDVNRGAQTTGDTPFMLAWALHLSPEIKPVVEALLCRPDTDLLAVSTDGYNALQQTGMVRRQHELRTLSRGWSGHWNADIDNPDHELLARVRAAMARQRRWSRPRAAWFNAAAAASALAAPAAYAP
ncbi:MAG: hypothetical protein EBU07_17465 [Betaproteobacteria bacterium]|nr:hypothetical protein [Betaproteobacteria bacterium]